MDDSRMPYEQVAEALRAAIVSGEFAPGDRLPTVNELAQQYGVARMTVQRAFNDLRDEGYIVSWQGRGTFVRDRSAEPSTGDSATLPLHEEVIHRLDRLYEKMESMDARLAQLEAQSNRGPSDGG